jgi:hypothetical protein
LRCSEKARNGGLNFWKATLNHCKLAGFIDVPNTAVREGRENIEAFGKGLAI